MEGTVTLGRKPAPHLWKVCSASGHLWTVFTRCEKNNEGSQITPTPKGMGLSTPRSGDGGAAQGQPEQLRQKHHHHEVAPAGCWVGEMNVMLAPNINTLRFQPDTSRSVRGETCSTCKLGTIITLGIAMCAVTTTTYRALELWGMRKQR